MAFFPEYTVFLNHCNGDGIRSLELHQEHALNLLYIQTYACLRSSKSQIEIGKCATKTLKHLRLNFISK